MLLYNPSVKLSGKCDFLCFHLRWTDEIPYTNEHLIYNLLSPSVMHQKKQILIYHTGFIILYNLSHVYSFSFFILVATENLLKKSICPSIIFMCFAIFFIIFTIHALITISFYFIHTCTSIEYFYMTSKLNKRQASIMPRQLSKCFKECYNV